MLYTVDYTINEQYFLFRRWPNITRMLPKPLFATPCARFSANPIIYTSPFQSSGVARRIEFRMNVFYCFIVGWHIAQGPWWENSSFVVLFVVVRGLVGRTTYTIYALFFTTNLFTTAGSVGLLLPWARFTHFYNHNKG